MFDGVEEAPPDPILSLAQLFKDDTFAQKVNLGIGAYRTEQGKPWPLPSVKAAEAVVLNDPQFDKEYIPIDGLPATKPLTQALIFGQESIQAKRIASSQALSGTGSLRIAGTFLKDFLKSTVIYVSDPTWGNHNAIFKKCGLDVKTYTYYHPPTRGFDFAGMMADLSKMPPKSGILLHACAHNPTGVDPTEEQWNEIIAVIKARKLYPIVDNAYQGYASGDLDADNLATQLLEAAGLEFFVCQSFAKNFGLYGERIGMVHAMCNSAERAKAVLSQIKMIIRPMYSSPPRHGAEVVLTVLGDPGLCRMWKDELKLMSDRILKMRALLRGKLEELGTPGTWNHITDQIGMFSYTGLTKAQCERLQDEFHIYLLKSGRISLAGINENNCDYLANCIDIVVREN
jgi:aspartate aminotransferase